MRVSIADKVCNLRATVSDARTRENLARFWQVFKTGPEGQLAYYPALTACIANGHRGARCSVTSQADPRARGGDHPGADRAGRPDRAGVGGSRRKLIEHRPLSVGSGYDS